jgi:DNA-binding SARP family transcriptional activator
LDAIPSARHTGYPGFYTRVKLALATAALLVQAPDLRLRIGEALSEADRAGATGYARHARLLDLLSRDAEAASGLVVALWSVEPGVIFANAEALLASLGALSLPAQQVVSEAAQARPSRWLQGLRRGITAKDARTQWSAARVIEEIGEKSDVRPLRDLSRSLKGNMRSPALGRALARRTADRVYVEDQGRVSLRIGDRVVAGTEMRRRPLALLCFLLSRLEMAATRDQVLDALWPDTDPAQAVNSLHQTVYFLRRVIEPMYSDDLSPGYINQDSELLWLDQELISSRSVQCRALIKTLGIDPPLDAVLQLGREYRGRFALDFFYEDWAADHRDSLHAKYLEVMERAIAAATSSGHFAEAMELSQAVLVTDPSLDQIEASLVKLYRLLGAHAAAAEQYQHYSSVMRNALGLEPPPLDEF